MPGAAATRRRVGAILEFWMALAPAAFMDFMAPEAFMDFMASKVADLLAMCLATPRAPAMATFAISYPASAAMARRASKPRPAAFSR